MSIRKRSMCALTMAAALILSSCGSSAAEAVPETESRQEDLITIGFSQLGAESDWRTANTDSIRETFSPEKGYNLIFEDGQQKQERQITAIRTFIQQEVDYILLAPVTETGWDAVLKEAKDAGIPVIIVDRMVDISDDSLYTAWIGSDFRLEGDKAGMWLHDYAEAMDVKQTDIKIVDIQGTIGGSAQIGRTEGLEEASRKYGWQLLDLKTGDYTRTKGKEVMEGFLEAYPDLNVVYCENDNEAFGAIEALEEAGRTVGPNLNQGEVLVISFDATTGGLKEVLSGKIALDVECNPLQGPQLELIIQMLEQGKTPDKQTFVQEELFGPDHTVPTVQLAGRTYPIRIVSEDLIAERMY